LEDKETLAKIAKGAKKQMKKGNFGQGARIARLVYETRIARAWHSRQETRVASNHASRQETPGARTARPVAESTSFELSVPSPAKRSVAGGRDTGWGHVVASGCHRPYVVPRAGVRRALTCRRASARALCARPPPLAQGG